MHDHHQFKHGITCRNRVRRYSSSSIVTHPRRSKVGPANGTKQRARVRVGDRGGRLLYSAAVWRCHHVGVRRGNQIPLTRESLQGLLDETGVPKDAYHLFGAHLDDAVVIDHRRQGWVVFYSERGAEFDLKTYQTEDAACRDLLARLRV